MKPFSLTIKAGEGALGSLKKDGFDISRIGTIAGASGGAKWLALSQLDRAIINLILPKLEGPVHLIGTSIGAWRSSCFAQNNPLAAIERFEEAYVEQRYSEDPDIDEISELSREIIKIVLGENGAGEILNHPTFRMHVMAVRSRHILASSNAALLWTGLLTAASLNMVSRSTLGAFFERALFFDARERPPCFNATGFPMQTVELTEANLEDAVVATGAIPLVLNGVRDIDGARPGTYRDGGVIDYHLDLPQSVEGRYTLYPHFFDRIVTGWFDKNLDWRRPDPKHVDNTILVSPSAQFVATLPNGKIPDRTDFLNFEPEERRRIWRTTIAACERMAEEFTDLIENDRLGEFAEPF